VAGLVEFEWTKALDADHRDAAADKRRRTQISNHLQFVLSASIGG
jgi:hypothetical protein